MENKKLTLFKKMRPFIGLIIFISLIILSTSIVFLSVASIFMYPLLWVSFTALHFIRPQKQGFLYALNAVRLAMWVYFVAIFLLLLWTPNWLKTWSAYLEGKTWWNVFKDGSYMCGRTGFAFILSLFVVTGFFVYYRWLKKHETQKKIEEDNQSFLQDN